MHNIKSGLKALEAVSCHVSRSLLLVLLLSVIMLSSRAEMDSRVTRLNAGDADMERQMSHLQPHTETRAYAHMKAHTHTRLKYNDIVFYNYNFP